MNQVLIVENDIVLREALAETLNLTGNTCLAASDGQEALAIITNHKPSLVLSDIRIDKVNGLQLLAEVQRRWPSIPVILMTGSSSVEEAVNAMREGAVDYLPKPFNGHTLIEKINFYLKPLRTIQEELPITHDPQSRELMAIALRVARSEVGVMISGESGTGKEVLAQFIHKHSTRHQQPFIAINCAAIPEQMLEATLFGYEKGAFTGAYKATPGKFEQAQNGTLLLDEVSEMSLNLQAKLLRVIQEKEVERIGSNKLIKLNVRILATSNRLLLDEVKAGRFREDLFYRLNVFPLHWLPLRERKGDIIPLANYLINRHCQHSMPEAPLLSQESIKELQTYEWPGNVRELDNVIQRALVLCNGQLIEPIHLRLVLDENTSICKSANERKLQSQEFALIEQTLAEQAGNRQQVAAILGISERTLRYKLARMREEGYVV